MKNLKYKMQNKNFNSLLERLARSKGIRTVFIDLVDAVLYGLIVQDRGILPVIL